MRRRTSAAVALAVALLVAAACGGDGDGDDGASPSGGGTTSAGGAPATTTEGEPTTTALPSRPNLDEVAVTLRQIAPLQRPTAMAVRPGDDALYVAEKGGRLMRLPGGQRPEGTSGAAGVVIDITGDVSNGSEQGLLGVTFSPAGDKLYVDYTDRAGDTRVVEYAFSDGRVGAGSRRELLFVDQPFPNHNGGQVVFGPDGKLYIGLGDGGSQRDPRDNGQSLGTLLGKILRIDPQPSGGRPYTVPADNPFVSRQGARPEIYAFGLRNPWRFSWDRENQDMWIADVGQNSWEEVDYLPVGRGSGANLGWSLMDSRHELKGENPPGGILPIHEYGHDDGSCSVTGGYVYRGSRIPALRGAYVFADYCTGVVSGLAQENGTSTDVQTLEVGGRMLVQSFGEDAAGELYLLSTTGIFRFEPR